MGPLEIVASFAQEKIDSIIAELNSGQLKNVLRAAGRSVKVPSGSVLPKVRRKIWSARILEGLEQSDEALGSEMLYQWLLHHRRNMLSEYLDALEVDHVRGETEESFTKSIPKDRLVSEALKLMKTHDPQEVAAYVLFLDHHQGSTAFTDNPDILNALRAAAGAAE